ncbi:hypothetical protein DCAR_0518663 [Daucus carota subsp. sativus]|uniref:non-specific serine/threonine protein kinase n=1 Tax=Daucus carota subsp. sativus TaxID=79200 RepID=A0AAF1B0L8_DAUCS|nr:PREDICTED: putative leucine-rich repeat receptor-like serine/threonine-protein kinase At2g24130 isoform X2 [Daucus carota subsp. sativus]WOG99315.1 hypothetical protein DCAR_0518663 [Daucus carota subsp. sativus]
MNTRKAIIRPLKSGTISSMRNMYLLLLHYLILATLGQVSGDHYHHSLESDRAALMEFKRTISADPHSTLANWNELVDVCNFTGVRCNKKRHRVHKLVLIDKGLVGLLSPFLLNLTRLQVLQLDGNNLHGSVPDSFSSFSKLILLTLAENNLTGTLPPSLFSNCTSLKNVDLSHNLLIGTIPSDIGKCPYLWNLNLYNNQFTGEIPSSLSNLSAMYNLDLEYNHLSGELPGQVMAQLPSLNFLHLSYNNMISHNNNTNLDPFFAALANCTRLREIELAGMGLGGSLPSSIGRLSTTVNIVLLQENQIFGSIPPAVGNLWNLSQLNLTSNLLNGTISPEISRMKNLEQLSLSYNDFTGEIPAALGQLRRLGLLDLSHNNLSGTIPENLGNLDKLIFLFLNNNNLSGEIPPSLGQCRDLDKLDLSYNKLTGIIPPQISAISEIRMYLNLSHNYLQGPLPIGLSKLVNVLEIDLSANNLSGHIFPQLSSCIAVRILNFSKNFLVGQLPESLGDLKNLEAFDVSNNSITGAIPASLSNIRSLTFLNFSYNNFTGKLPSGGFFDTATNLSFLGNEHICGRGPGIQKCHQEHHYFHSRVFLIIFCVVISVSAFFSTICCVLGYRHVQRRISTTTIETETNSEPELMPNFPRMPYKQLSEATGGFNEQNLIGSGSYGRVYKGVLPDGIAVAVKVLQLQTGNSTKSFTRECEVLRRIRHRNLIRIITACSLPDFKALVLPYMVNGSLESRMYQYPGTTLRSDSSDLNLIQMVNICSDIAEGMAYLHHHSPVRVIHCDLKPSNVLLNDDMTALVSDFGIARLVMTIGGNAPVIENMGDSTANMLSGTIGYIAPEYGFGSGTSIKGDVYSFGVLVLEMVTRKRPTDDMFTGGLSLHTWVKSHYHGRMEKIINSNMVRAIQNQSPEVKRMWEVAVGELIELGILCTQSNPSARPTMLDAADDLDRLKRYLGGETTATFASSLGMSSSTIGDD